MLLLSQLLFLLLLLLFLTWPTCALLDIRFTFFGALPKPATNRHLAFTHFSFTCRRTTEKKRNTKKETAVFFLVFSNCFLGFACFFEFVQTVLFCFTRTRDTRAHVKSKCKSRLLTSYDLRARFTLRCVALRISCAAACRVRARGTLDAD